ncbi:carbamoyltransferase family protein [Sphingomonas lycopersici]|uniref:Carbamoyl transferase n=1 Tax=Sphingomonas lycopersici TaxID=2951807 RepID=A0AA41ZAE3_9SPHN|nr:carbamoyltransferase N-terminal domain-containing protein [Sphingomonas lycopersici]MCW6536955.1 carbamoyl transferase [Sphingomonas lycopersici]
MRILGISAHYHDSAAALVIDGVPVAALQEERLSRRKNDASFPIAAIEWCLDHAGLKPDDLDAVIFYEQPGLKFDRILMSSLRGFPRSWRSFPHAMKNMLGEKLWMRGVIASQLGVPLRKILCTDHHLSHAAASFFTAPCEQAAILTADGVGEWATMTVGIGSKRAGGPAEIKLLRELRFPHSLGLFYSAFTSFLGFAVNEGEYKVMGLAAFGRPTYLDAVRTVIPRTKDGGFELDQRYFDFLGRAETSFNHRFVDLFGAPRNPYEPIDLATADGRRFADVAASAQRVLEEILIDIATDLQRQTGLRDLCFGGGVALNGVANARLLAETGFEHLYIPSAPGDAGCALGAALVADRLIFGRNHRPVPDHPFWGPAVDPATLARLASEDDYPAIAASYEQVIDDTAVALARGEIVGWMQGALEFGPRALGHRSILAAPHTVEMRDRLNQAIKFREQFRPFAPVVTADVAGRYFELPPGGDRLGRFMSGVFPVRPEWRDQLAAVTHVDGTARVQVLEPAMEPLLARLLDRYGRITGIPVLLNTSFNLAGEPIVNTVAEGYSTFRRCGIDMLVAGNVMMRKRQEPQLALEEAAE